MSELPSGWVVCQLSDIGHIVTGKTPSTKEPRFYGGEIPFIKPGDLDQSGPVISTEVYLTDDGLAEVPALPPDSIVVTCIGNLGKVGITTKLSASNQQINAVVPDQGVDPTYIFHYCKTLKPWLESESSATTISIVNKGIFSTAPIPLPPLAEQTRIAAKLDELLAQVDTLKARIDGIPALLKRFRQSVLAAAVSGRLTEEWRVQNVGLADEASLPENQHEDIWPKISLKSLIASLEQGWSPKCESDSVAEAEEAWAVIKTTSIQPIEFYPSENKRLPESLSPRPELSVQAGDLLITRAGPRSRAAVCCYVKKTQPYLMVCDKAYRLRTQASVMDGRLLCLFLNSPQYISLLDDLKTGISESGMNLTMRKFQELQIPHPSLEEQAEIVRRVEQLFAFADQLQAKVGEAKTRIDRLTQSILAKAFRGELVPQDPNDEPASELLARITAQRANATKAKRGRKSG